MYAHVKLTGERPKTRFNHLYWGPQFTNDEIEVVLPATPALSGIKEVALTFGRSGQETPVDLSILGFDFIPFDVALDSPR
mgnify:CR=1 FL=1